MDLESVAKKHGRIVVMGDYLAYGRTSITDTVPGFGLRLAQYLPYHVAVAVAALYNTEPEFFHLGNLPNARVDIPAVHIILSGPYNIYFGYNIGTLADAQKSFEFTLDRALSTDGSRVLILLPPDPGDVVPEQKKRYEEWREFLLTFEGRCGVYIYDLAVFFDQRGIAADVFWTPDIHEKVAIELSQFFT